MRTSILHVMALTALGWASEAAGQIRPIPIQGPIRHFRYGEGAGEKSAPRIIYSNTLGGRFYTPLGAFYEFIDWATITGSQDHDVVTGLSFGYGTAGPSAAFRYRIYDHYTGYCGTLGATVFDISLTGLPGSPPGTSTGWVVNLDLKAIGSCFYLDEGPFGYSYSYLGDDRTGPLFALGGTGNTLEVDVVDHAAGTCYTAFGGEPFQFYTELTADDGHDTFPGGCGGGLALSIDGSTCTGDTVSIEVSGASAGHWWAVALGTTIGPAVGGVLGGCPVDVVPVVPILLMGQLPSQPLTFPATVNIASGLTVGIQVITKDPASGAFDSSNTEIINVP